MSPTPNFDLKVKTILDVLKPGERMCAITGEKWMMTEEEIGWYKKFNVPPSRVSPQTRWKIHGSWFVGFQFWTQKHPETGAPIIGTIHPATGYKMLPDKEWFSKDFTCYGRTYDPAQPFFTQFHALQLDVPMLGSRNHIEPINSIAVVSQGDENSYFVCACKSKNTFVGHVAMNVEDSAELYYCDNVTRSFNVAHASRIFDSQFVRSSRDCLSCAFLFDCRNCEYCFGAVNRRNAKYLWMNEQLTKDEWEKRRAEVDLGSTSVVEWWKKAFRDLMDTQAVWPENWNEQCLDSTGEFLNQATNVHETYISGSGSGKNLYRCNFSIGDSENNAFCGYPVWATNNLYCISVNRSNECRYSMLCIQSQGMEYSFMCYNCENCFGCTGLQRKKFCIFNKEYAEEEYWKRVDELKCAMLERGEYGEFFPVSQSPSYYADASGIWWFGSTHEEMKEKFQVLDYAPESCGAIGMELADAKNLRDVSELPDHVKDLSAWIGVPLFDHYAQRRFALLEPEVKLYQNLGSFPSRKHFIARMRDLWMDSNRGVFVPARCDKCQKPLMVADNLNYPSRRFLCREDYLKHLEQHGS